jgi:hypothetical protein
MYKIIELIVDDTQFFVVYNKIKGVEEDRFLSYKEASDYIIGK